MSLAIWFWIILVLWILFGAWYGWSVPAAERAGRLGGVIIPLVLFILLGWKVFGSPVSGG